MSPRRLFAGLCVTGAAAFAAYGLLSLGGSFSERLDVLTHFAPLALAGGLLLLAAGLLAVRGRARRALVALCGIGLACTAGLMLPEAAAALRSSPPPTPDAERVRVLQFNVYRYTNDRTEIARTILDSDADVVVLQEAYDAAAPVADLVRRRYPHQIGCRGDARPCGTRVLSRRAPLASGGVHAPHDRDGSVNAAWLTLPLADGGRATVVGTHATWPIPAGPQGAQMRALARVLERFEQDTLILAGDFNSTPWSFALRRHDRMFGLERRTRALFSWPAFVGPVELPFALLPIDHVYAGPAWSTVSIQRAPQSASDHYPVVVELARRPALARLPS